MLFVLTNNTAVIIVISAFGAIALQVISMVSFFILRKKEPNMERPYKAPYFLAVVAIVIDAVFLITVTYANKATIGWVIGAFVLAGVYYFIYSKVTRGQAEMEAEEKAV
jgi:ethanolamine permease